jgi:hypothetical protein
MPSRPVAEKKEYKAKLRREIEALLGLKLEKVSYGATYIRKPLCRSFFRAFAAKLCRK